MAQKVNAKVRVCKHIKSIMAREYCALLNHIPKLTVDDIGSRLHVYIKKHKLIWTENL